jgi:very-short-patch-repair endonuclease
VARVDLAFPEQRVAIEYDGAWHGRQGRLARDRRRLDALVAADWTVLHVTGGDLHDPSAPVNAVRRLLLDRGVVHLPGTDERCTSPRWAPSPAT